MTAPISLASFAPLAPFLVLALGGMAVLLLDALFGRGRAVPWALVAAPIPVLALALRAPERGGPTDFGGMYVADSFGTFVAALICLATLLAVLLSETYLRRMGRYRGDYFALLLFSAAGMILFASATEILSLFLGLELLSMPIYILCGFLRKDPRSVEASMKYFLLGAFSSGLFLFGGALVYAATGTSDLDAAFAQPAGGMILSAGALLLVTGFLFKVAAVPFHMWTPDVYEGAPTAVTAFMAAAVKAAAFAAFARILVLARPSGGIDALPGYLWWIALATMSVGNLAALIQPNIKRMLAYSSIAHAGYLLIGLSVYARTGSPDALSAILYYLLAYVLMNTGAFAVVVLWGGEGEERLEISDWAGFGWKHPGAALALSIFMISLAGIPPTAGFFGKYYLFRNAVENGFTTLVVLAVLNSAVSVAYYLRVLVALYMRPAARPLEAPRSILTAAVVLACALAVLWIGFAPDGLLPGVPALLGMVRESVASLP
jgi:NADH-quinone oxidoreductase subunit N